MNKTALVTVPEKWRKWKTGKDDGWIYDDIFDFVDGEISRGEMVEILDYLERKYSEWLIKEKFDNRL